MAHNIMSLLIPKENVTGLPSKENCAYTPHYCEENIWMLVKKIEETSPEKLQCCFPVFISNEIKFIPLWQQSVSKQVDGFVAWDYHVILVYCDSEKSLVFDFDTQLQFPTPFEHYCEETFKSDDILQPQYHRLFRIIPSDLYLKHFSSDRSHMKKEDGSWVKPPPNYPCIKNSEDIHNLDQYISMKEDYRQSNKFGNIINLSSFISRFSKNCYLSYLYPPEPLQPSWLE